MAALPVRDESGRPRPDQEVPADRAHLGDAGVWLKTVTGGPLITYRGEAVKPIIVSKAKLRGQVNSTSTRHAVGG